MECSPLVISKHLIKDMECLPGLYPWHAKNQKGSDHHVFNLLYRPDSEKNFKPIWGKFRGMGRGEFFLNKEKDFSEVIAKEIFKASIYLKVAKVGGHRDKGGTVHIYIIYGW